MVPSPELGRLIRPTESFCYWCSLRHMRSTAAVAIATR